MKKITKAEFDVICSNGKSIDIKGGYPSVVLHPDGSVTKLWARKKGLFSSARLSPYSNRFIKNAGKLAKRGIEVPDITNHTKLENSHIRLVSYRALPGNSIRELIHSSPEKIDLTDLCRYICTLHEKGILFGVIHLGNIIQTKNGYGLIDFTDVRFFNRPLSPKQRAKTLRVPLRYHEDIHALIQAEHPDFVDTYLSISGLGSEAIQEIKKTLVD